jgi:hypothetical protein
MKRIIVLVIVVLYSSLNGISQEKDSLSINPRRNGISFNPTPMLLCNSLKNITFVYERMLKANQSAVLQLGYLEFNQSLLDSINRDGSIRQKSNFGLNFAFQYRFYPARLNRQQAPFGLYLGPYASYYGIKTTSTFNLSETDPTKTEDVKTSFNMFNLGIGIGYQFIFKDRISIDLLAFGPSLTYSFKNKTYSGDVPSGDQAAISDQMDHVSTTDYPLLSQFIEIYGNESSASFTTFFRYAITFGYRF